MLIMGGILCLYMAGLVWNDVCDRRRDAQNRLLRPIPMGRISPGVATLIAWILAGTSLVLFWQSSITALAYGACLLCCVIAYDFYLKRVPILGVISMGLCRGISLLLGATATTTRQPFTASVWIAFLMVTGYVAAVTQMAKRERYPHNPSLEVWGPWTAITLGLLLFAHTVEVWSGWLVLLMLIVFGLPLAAAIHLHDFRTTRNLPKTLDCKQRIPQVLPPWIGYLIAHLLWISMFFVLSTGVSVDTLIVCGILFGCWLMNRLLGRFFYAS